MSNTFTPKGLGIGAQQATPSDHGETIGNISRRTHEFDMPGGKTATVGIRLGTDTPPDAAEQRRQFFESVWAPSLTEGLEKEVNALTERFNQILGYDADGEPKYRYQGREREVLEMQLGNRRNALALAVVNRRYAEQVQAEAKDRKAKEFLSIEAKAQKRAGEMIEEQAIERRAAVIAGRAGVKPHR